MAGSNSYERGGEPRTTPDAYAAEYDAMIRKQRQINAAQEAEGEPGHHWAIRQADKSVPDVIKNQPWNIKGGLDDVSHGRIDHRYGDLPRFNEAQRIWYGTPDWFKAANISAPGHAGTASGRAVYGRDEPSPRR